MKNPIYFVLVTYCVCAIPLVAMEKVDPDKELLALVRDEYALTKSVESKEIGSLLFHPLIKKLAEILNFCPSENAINSACEIIKKNQKDDYSMLWNICYVTQSFKCSDEYKETSQRKRDIFEKKLAVCDTMHQLLVGHFQGHTLEAFRLAEEKGLFLR